jgi:hypothetical protein
MALRDWGKVGQVIAEAPGEAAIVMRDAVGGGAYQGAREARWCVIRPVRG